MVVQMGEGRSVRSVICTVGSAVTKAKLATDLGADWAINYKTDDVVVRVKEAVGGLGVEGWFETVPPSDFDKTCELMTPRGRIVVMAGRAARPVFPNGPFYVKGLSLLGFAMFNMSAGEQQVCADDMNRWMRDGEAQSADRRPVPAGEDGRSSPVAGETTRVKIGRGTLTGKIRDSAASVKSARSVPVITLTPRGHMSTRWCQQLVFFIVLLCLRDRRSP